jgi:hypothetical protein
MVEFGKLVDLRLSCRYGVEAAEIFDFLFCVLLFVKIEAVPFDAVRRAAFFGSCEVLVVTFV